MHSGIDVTQETNGYCNMYAANIAVSYLHSMSDSQLNAIHYFEDNYEIIFKVLLDYLSGRFIDPKNELGFTYVNILNKNKENICFTEYTFIDSNGRKIKVSMYKSKLYEI